MEDYLNVLKKYAEFSGRARRREYWMFYLFNLIIGSVLIGIGTLIKFPYFSAIYSLFVLIPGIAVFVRRLHDLGKSGAWFFIVLIPLVGGIWLLILMATAGQPQTNAYGPDPKQV
jgi:uncharacterized membrane protein YhaH (DUF805 family)